MEAKNTIGKKIYVVKDATGQLKLSFALALMMVFSVWGFGMGIEPIRNVWWLFFIMTVLAIPVAFRLKAIWNGIVLDLNKGTMEFPGGGIAANDFLDYLRPRFLLQLFCRESININGIQEIGKKSRGNYDSPEYLITIAGDHGAVNVSFADEGKRNELFNVIRNINNMGTPVFNSR